MQKDIDNLSNNLYQLLFILHKRILNPNDMMKRFTLPPSHMKVLFYLKHTGQSTISQIAKDLDISKPNMTPIIDKLIQEDFVQWLFVHLIPKSMRKISSIMQIET